MLSDVRNYYGLARDFGQAGYFETEHSEQIVRELKLEIKAGKLVALSGIIGSGKSTMLRRIQEALSQDKEFLASKSLSVEKGQITLATLIMALFYAKTQGPVAESRRSALTMPRWQSPPEYGNMPIVNCRSVLKS
jgi:type II secretory pathway predicted ATPase ExeA